MSTVKNLQTGIRAHVRRLQHIPEVRLLWRGPGLRGSRIVVVMVVRNEALRLPHAIDYYRKLGADHFLVIDNCSDDETLDVLRAAGDTTVVRARGSFRNAHYGIDWVNHLLGRFCVGKWVLHVDADEYLVWHAPGLRTLPELCDALDALGRQALQAVMIDMYSELPAKRNTVLPGQDPLEITPLFDADGYDRIYDARMRGTWIKGGVRGRHFFADDITRGPALNKTPLVRWRSHYAFVQVAHELWPRMLNGGQARPALALLHYKFTSFSVAKVTDEDVRSEHTSEYDAYDDIDSRVLVSASTRRFTSASDLVDAGIIEPVPRTG